MEREFELWYFNDESRCSYPRERISGCVMCFSADGTYIDTVFMPYELACDLFFTLKYACPHWTLALLENSKRYNHFEFIRAHLGYSQIVTSDFDQAYPFLRYYSDLDSWLAAIATHYYRINFPKEV